MNLYLIGYRGCGKSSVGPLLATQLGWATVDSDAVVKQQAQCSIAQMFADQGEGAFRTLEQQVIAKISQGDQQVVSLGGGAVMFEPNRQAIASTGKAIWLTAPAEVLWKRINSDQVSTTQRPDLTDDGGFTEVQKVLADRASVYEACADYTAQTADLTPEQIADELFQWWNASSSSR